jgi:hypothetical protein
LIAGFDAAVALVPGDGIDADRGHHARDHFCAVYLDRCGVIDRKIPCFRRLRPNVSIAGN